MYISSCIIEYVIIIIYIHIYIYIYVCVYIYYKWIRRCFLLLSSKIDRAVTVYLAESVWWKRVPFYPKVDGLVPQTRHVSLRIAWKAFGLLLLSSKLGRAVRAYLTQWIDSIV